MNDMTRLWLTSCVDPPETSFDGLHHQLRRPLFLPGWPAGQRVSVRGSDCRKWIETHQAVPYMMLGMVRGGILGGAGAQVVISHDETFRARLMGSER